MDVPQQADLWLPDSHPDGEPLQRGKLTTAADMITFALAGNARLTLVSLKTGNRYTYRIRRPKNPDNPNCPFFVAVMYGADNETDFAYIGYINPRTKEFLWGRKSKIANDDARVRAFVWFWTYVLANRLPPNLEVWHEGRCCRCGRALTVPSSIANGIGPECIKKVPRMAGLDIGQEKPISTPKPPRRVVDLPREKAS